MEIKTLLGLILEITAIVSLIWCILVLRAVLKLAFVIKRSPVYIISAANIFADSLTLANFVFYLCPCIITDRYLISDKRENVIALVTSIIATTSWFIISFSQILMAINRLVVICFTWITFFSYKVVLILVILIIPASLGLSIFVQFISPCCMLILDHSRLRLSYIELPEVSNFSNLYVNVPLNIVTSSTAIVCYSMIFFYVHRVALKMAHVQLSGKRRHEYLYALQFCAISLFHLLVWVSLRLFPLIMNDDPSNNNWFAFTTFCSIFSSLANAAVYSFFNKEVKAIIFNRSQPVMQSRVGKPSTAVSPTSK